MQKFIASCRKRKESGRFGEYLLQQMQQLEDELRILKKRLQSTVLLTTWMINDLSK